MKEDFYHFFQDFHGNFHLSKAINSSFLSLILKKDNSLGASRVQTHMPCGVFMQSISKTSCNQIEEGFGSYRF